MTTTLTMDQRYEAMAILERLTANDTTTFDSADARRLIELIPRFDKRVIIDIGVGWQSRDSRSEGYAAGVGNVSLDEKGQRKTKSLTNDVVHRIGGYKVTHHPGQIAIALMWAETQLSDPAGFRCRLIYHRKSGAPQAIKLLQPATFDLFVIQLTFARYADWKTPAA